MRKNILILLIVSFMIFVSCSKKENFVKQDYSNSEGFSETPNSRERYYKEDLSETPQDISENEESPENDALSDDEIQKIGKKIIKNAEISLEVDNYSKSLKKIKDTLNAFDCNISEENETNYGTSISNKITIRVKAKEFDDLLNAILSGDGTVSSKSITVNDVTEQYIDVYQRLKTKKKVRAQYEVYLKKANTINDILNVKNYIRQIQEEIEVTEGRLKYMNKQADYSTIILNISQNPKEIVENNFWNQLTEGLSTGWHGLLYIILGIFYIWPLWILVVIIIFVTRSIKKKRQKKQKND